MTGVSSLAVWAANKRSGLLARETRRNYVFAYDPDAGTDVQVSLTMPVRLESWVSRELHPIFQMNLPEGALLEAIRRAISKVIGEDELSILRVTGGNQVGKNHFAFPGEPSPYFSETPESLHDLLTYPDTTELFHDLVTTTAYIRNDVPALTLAGTKKWWPCKLLERFAVVHPSLPKASVFTIFDRMAQAVTETRQSIPHQISEHPEFREVGEQMIVAWDEGLKGITGYG